jgi:hypothetical protein
MPEVVNDYLRLFVNRRAYTLQSMRPHPASGRHYYFRPTKKDTGAPLELTKETPRWTIRSLLVSSLDL